MRLARSRRGSRRRKGRQSNAAFVNSTATDHAFDRRGRRCGTDCRGRRRHPGSRRLHDLVLHGQRAALAAGRSDWYVDVSRRNRSSAGDVLAFTPANTLYGINYSTRSLYTIDPSTASPTFIGFTGSRGGTQLTATGDGKLWSTIGSPVQPSDLYQVNPSTGQATLVGPIDQGWVTGIAGMCSGHLFGYSAGNLLSIDPATGAGSVIGATGLTSETLLISFDQDEHLWGVGSGIYRLDTRHGTATFVAHTTSDFRTLALPRTCHH
jgi:hypothetical protein